MLQEADLRGFSEFPATVVVVAVAWIFCLKKLGKPRL
jgi:hypothetical protein